MYGGVGFLLGKSKQAALAAKIQVVLTHTFSLLQLFLGCVSHLFSSTVGTKPDQGIIVMLITPFPV